jgi:hypothetical protein
MRKVLISVSLLVGLLALPATSAFAVGTSQTFKGKATATLTITDSTTGAFTIQGNSKIKRLGLTSFTGSGTITSAHKASYTVTWTTPNGDTVTTSSNSRSDKVGKRELFVAVNTITGGSGRYAGATGSATSIGKVRRDATDANVLHVKLLFRGTINY